MLIEEDNEEDSELCKKLQSSGLYYIWPSEFDSLHTKHKDVEKKDMLRNDGKNYAPKGKPSPVVESGEFVIAAVALDHGHVYGMCNGLVEAGATLKWVYDPYPQKVAKFLEAFPQAKAAVSEEEVLSDPEVKLVASAAVTSERCALGLRVMYAGKDYFTDKAPLTSLEQLETAKKPWKKPV